MKPSEVLAVWFSPTGTTEEVTGRIARTAAETLGVPMRERPFTLPAQRAEPLRFEPGQLVVFGTPVIAGRVPNVLLKYLAAMEGHGAAAVPVVCYGNRDYDDALIELRDLLETSGCRTIAGGAFIGEHSFSKTLAAGRPDEADCRLAETFGRLVAEKCGEEHPAHPVPVRGTSAPYRGYYQPRDRAGAPVDIRKVKPVTSAACTDCGLCADLCPMGSIDPGDVRNYVGICIKCGACVKGCPVGAKGYDDPGYLYHKVELEEGYTRRAEPEWFV